jgi:regulator of protease activity HflC (stomatin/prohibitin superfamily)
VVYVSHACDAKANNDVDESAMPLLEVYSILAVVALYVYFAMRFVGDDERIIIFRAGRPLREVGPGMVFVWPFLDTFKHCPVKAQMFRVSQIELQCGLTVGFTNGSVVFRITDAFRAYGQSQNPESEVEQVVRSALSTVISRTSIDQCIRSVHRIESEVVKEANEVTKNWGVRIVTVQLGGLPVAGYLIAQLSGLLSFQIAGLQSVINEVTEIGREADANSALPSGDSAANSLWNTSPGEFL